MGDKGEKIWEALLSLEGTSTPAAPSVPAALAQYGIDRRFDRSSKLLGFSQHSQRGLYLVLALYLLFQVSLLAATCPSANLPCSLWWLPLSLSALASGVTASSVLRKLRCAAEFRRKAEHRPRPQPHPAWCGSLLNCRDGTLTVCLVAFSTLAVSARVQGLCRKP